MRSRKYSYRRDLPHIEKAERAHFITFNTYHRWILPPTARDLVLKHCLHDNAKKFRLLVSVVMPDHVHMIFTPLRDQNPEPFTFEEIVGAIKSASAHSINKLLNRSGLSGNLSLLTTSCATQKVSTAKLTMCGKTR